MLGPRSRRDAVGEALPKSSTGIRGFDAITFGGLPRGRATLVTGAAGAGKSLFGIEFLVRGAQDFGEPGVLMTFEESTDDLIDNAASLGFDLAAMIDAGTLILDSAVGQSDQLVASGAFDLDGLFIRLGAAIDAVGAKRVVLDTVELLFAELPDPLTVRRELSRLLRWLRDREVTVVVTGERGTTTLTRHGIEEYVSDCVVILDHRVVDETATRRLRVAKYRGSDHATNEYPFVISSSGITVMPMRRSDTFDVSDERVGLGVPDLDDMLGGGVFRGSTTLISGSAGTGKTSIGVSAVVAACERGERALFVSLEEAPSQVIRNLRSIGLDLQRWIDAGLLTVRHLRPAAMGLEEHLAEMHLLFDELQPDFVVVDAVAGLLRSGSPASSTALIGREVDLLRTRGVTAIMTTLAGGDGRDATEISASSLVDTWIVVKNFETDGERTRLLYVIKNRGTAHSNQVREFQISGEGLRLVDVFVGPRGVLTGSRREAQMDLDRREHVAQERESERRRRKTAARKASVEAQIAALEHQLEADLADSALEEELLVDDVDGGIADREASGSKRMQRGSDT